MSESIPSQDELQREEAEIRENPEKLLNFQSNLPGGHYRKMVDHPTFKDLKDLRDPNLKNKTYKEFHEDVDKAMEEEKISIGDVLELYQVSGGRLGSNVETPDGKNVFKELTRLALPVYLNLRRKGYSEKGLKA